MPSGGFSEFRTPEEQEQDAELAAELAGVEESAAPDDRAEEADPGA